MNLTFVRTKVHLLTNQSEKMSDNLSGFCITVITAHNLNDPHDPMFPPPTNPKLRIVRVYCQSFPAVLCKKIKVLGPQTYAFYQWTNTLLFYRLSASTTIASMVYGELVRHDFQTAGEVVSHLWECSRDTAAEHMSVHFWKGLSDLVEDLPAVADTDLFEVLKLC
jgi:hypothetical protein